MSARNAPPPTFLSPRRIRAAHPAGSTSPAPRDGGGGGGGGAGAGGEKIEGGWGRRGGEGARLVRGGGHEGADSPPRDAFPAGRGGCVGWPQRPVVVDENSSAEQCLAVVEKERE